jgi:predicted CXXCH cytochrome family protein
VLIATIGCQGFRSADSTTQKDEVGGQGGAIIPPLVESPPDGAESGASATEAEAQRAGAPAESTGVIARADAAPGQDAGAARQEAQATARKVERPTTSIPTSGCVTTDCHPGVKAAPFKHGPVDTDTCDACHEEVDASGHTFKMLNTGAELCGSCHELELEEEYVHQPAAEDLCVECHHPHGGQDRFMLRAAGAATCTECHDDVTEGMPMVHGPAAAGACTACHRSHCSSNAKLLALPERELCLECHLALRKRLETVRTVHDPVTAECVACHSPHATEHKMMLKAQTVELCVDCHSDIEEQLDAATAGHDPVSTGPACRNCHNPHCSEFPAMLLNDMTAQCLSCHDREIELADGTKLADMKACLESGSNRHGPIAQANCAGGCHEVHGGANFRILAGEYPAEFYAPFDEEAYELCFSCHDRQLVLDPHTDRLTNFRNGDHNQHYVHVNKPVKGRTCRACHQTHASARPKHIRDGVPFGAGGWMLPINFEKTETGGRCSPGCHRPYAYDRDKPVDNEIP